MSIYLNLTTDECLALARALAAKAYEVQDAATRNPSAYVYVGIGHTIDGESIRVRISESNEG